MKNGSRCEKQSRSIVVERSEIILPLPHTTFAIMKQFMEAINRNGDSFKYICTKFSGSTINKLKASTFGRPHIRKLAE